ncbi:capsular biosynthesis protein [Corallincola luteus]|uniref:Capsular biosynthesis protein n=1 Tax=Corallincola luteus TaxID=1775177 RepID=A0ABY2AMD6_9GAMM|nr:phosphotransferase [Corallincola luteus]TCI04120.1 capsular biosynthesis protein [Corallincola luteus]
MFLITSAAYIGQEFSSEFGRLPPAFLPVGNRRLYRYQREVLPANERIVLSLPEAFELPEYDRRILEQLNIEPLFLPEGLSLGESVICALNLLGHANGPIRILHGDTLIYDLPTEAEDIITLSPVDDNYAWAIYDSEQTPPLSQLQESDLVTRRAESVVNGYFSFSDARLLIQSITRARGNFIDGINRYAAAKPLKPLECQEWFDFGHLHTYYRSKTHVSTTRVFNQMAIENGVVQKRSHKRQKMRAEAHWFASLPTELKRFTPNYLGALDDDEQPGYAIEYLYLTSLNEMWVFGNLPAFVWRRIGTACLDFFMQCRQHVAPKDTEIAPAKLFGDKTTERLALFAKENRIDLNHPWHLNGKPLPNLNQIAANALDAIPAASSGTIIHGDLCFSNILYDFRSQQIKVIDPRGLDNKDNLTVYGNPDYDLAKFAHSVVGRYDFIIAGYYQLTQDGYALDFNLPTTETHDQVEALFLTRSAQGLGRNEQQLLAMQVHLFLSMLPLHNDDERRQMALLANALRLYQRLQALSLAETN